MPGELRVTVSMADGADDLSPTVLAKLEELRPAGIRLLTGSAATVTLAARVELTLAGSHLPAADVEAVHRAAATALVGAVTRTGVGQKVRAAPAAAAILADARVVDVVAATRPEGFRPRIARRRLRAGRRRFGPPRCRRRGLRPRPLRGRGGDDLAHRGRRVGDGRGDARGRARSPTELAGLLTARLTALVSSIGAGSVIDANAVLDALRDDAHYQLDPLTLQVRFTLGDTFVEVAPGGAAFTAQAGQTFTVAGVTVK